MQRCLPSVLVLGLLLLLAGCGGGGGPKPVAGALSYLARWTPGTRSGPTGASQRVRILELSGVTLADLSLITTADSLLQFPGLPNRKLRVLAELYSGPNRSGSITGTVESVIDGAAASSITSAIRESIVEIQLHSSVTSLKTGETTRILATPRTDIGEAIFVAPGDLTWTSSNPGLATVSPDGLVTGIASGNVVITARHTATGVTATRNLAITSDAVTRSKWTVLVFINASNNLYPYALQNMNQMERVASNPNVRFVVQWKQVQGVGGNTTPLFSGTRRYLVRPDLTSDINSLVRQDLGTGVDMGDWRELRKFVQWGKAAYPADRYALVLWNHGSGWAPGKFSPSAISFDDETNNVIDIWELTQALGTERFDLIASDACNMSMLEMAQEVATNTDFVIGSEEETPAPGYPYHRVFKPFVDNPDATTRSLTEGFVSEFMSFYVGSAYDRLPLCQSVIETSKLPDLTTALNALSGQLLSQSATIAPSVATVRSNVRRYSSVIGDHQFYDLWALADELGTVVPGLATQTAAVKSAVLAAVPFNQQNATAATLGFKSKGIAIEFGRSTTFSLGSYQRLKLAPLTQWEEFLSNPVANP